MDNKFCKANNGSGNNIKRDEWETPQWLFDILNNQYNFGFDCCVSESNKKCELYSSDFFGAPTDCICWMNPPFSKALIMFRNFFEFVKKGVAIYRCDNMETKVLQEVIFPNATWVFIPNKRIAYEGMEGSGSRFPSALIGFNVDIPKNIDGVILR